MTGMKLAVVGGGSTYTPELVDGLARLGDTLPVDELVLLDPDTERLAVVGAFAQRILDARGASTRLRLTSSRDDAVDGASAVLLQLRVGGQAARAGDESFPLECGCVGQETTGAGGLAKALRTVPVVLDIAETVRERAAKDAWIVDFTNPVGIVTRSLLQAGHRAVGLCNVAIGFQRMFAGWLGVAPEQVLLDPDSPRLEVVGAFAQRILTERGASTKLVLTSDLDAAVDGASAVSARGRATRRSRSPATASARRPPAPEVSRRRCARCPSSSTSPRRCASARRRTPGSSTSPTRSGS